MVQANEGWVVRKGFFFQGAAPLLLLSREIELTPVRNDLDLLFFGGLLVGFAGGSWGFAVDGSPKLTTFGVAWKVSQQRIIVVDD